MKTFLKTTAISAACLIASIASPAAAQSNAKFGADEAAYCTATFAWILEFLAPKSLPQEAVIQTNVAFMMWNYELDQAMGKDTTEEQFRARTTKALTTLAQKMPKHSGGQDTPPTKEEAQKMANFVMAEAQTCGNKITSSYADINAHPVLVSMKQQAEKARAAQANKPITLPQN